MARSALVCSLAVVLLVASFATVARAGKDAAKAAGKAAPAAAEQRHQSTIESISDNQIDEIIDDGERHLVIFFCEPQLPAVMVCR